jgi:putative lipoprotein (rSAM/lipoprotein system)
MKKIEIKFLNASNAILVILLAVLGFASSCSGPTTDYGVPNATFIIKGQIISDKDSLPIPGIQVVMRYDSSLTGSNGNYTIEQNSSPSSQTFNLKIKDVDGTANGEYISLDTIIEFKDAIFTGGSGDWNKGKTEKEVNIKLKRK